MQHARVHRNYSDSLILKVMLLVVIFCLFTLMFIAQSIQTPMGGSNTAACAPVCPVATWAGGFCPVNKIPWRAPYRCN